MQEQFVHVKLLVLCRQINIQDAAENNFLQFLNRGFGENSYNTTSSN